jgi:hypothetical protein
VSALGKGEDFLTLKQALGLFGLKIAEEGMQGGQTVVSGAER